MRQRPESVLIQEEGALSGLREVHQIRVIAVTGSPFCSPFDITADYLTTHTNDFPIHWTLGSANFNAQNGSLYLTEVATLAFL